jgi:hypothetical protein
VVSAYEIPSGNIDERIMKFWKSRVKNKIIRKEFVMELKK